MLFILVFSINIEKALYLHNMYSIMNNVKIIECVGCVMLIPEKSKGKNRKGPLSSRAPGLIVVFGL